MSITKQELKKRLTGCQSVGEINAILQAAGLPDEVELSDEVAGLVEVAYSLIKQGIPLAQAIEYARSGQMPEPEINMESLLIAQAQAGADFKNHTETAILQEDVTNSAKRYLQAYYPLFAAAINSEAVLTDPEVTQSMDAARKMILGDRIGSNGKTFLQQAVIGAASKNLLPQLQPVKAVLSAGQSAAK